MSDRITRREFAGAVASTSTLAVVGGAVAEEPAKKVDPSSEKEKAAEKVSTLELIIQVAKQEFPHEKLDAAAIEEIRIDVRGNLGRSKILSAYPLSNSDEPGFTFAAWRKDPV